MVKRLGRAVPAAWGIAAFAFGSFLLGAHSDGNAVRAADPRSATGADAVGAPLAEATPNCPGSPGAAEMPPGARPADSPNDDFTRCTALKVVGNTYVDNNRNGRYESNGGDWRLPGARVRLSDAGTGQVIGETITNQDGYFRFPLLPLGPVYHVEVFDVEGYVLTTPGWRDLELRDFSLLWCCTGRADFGFYQPTGPRGGPVVPPPPPVAPGGPVPPPPCCEIPTGRQIHLPILNYEANDNVCNTIIEAQNVGAWPSKALLMVWGAPGFCPPQCTGPLKVECSGLLAPGSTWNFLGAQLPGRAKSGMVFSAPAIETSQSGGPSADVFADLLCEALFHDVVGSCDNYRRFKQAFNSYGVWQTATYNFDFRRYAGASLAVEVVRKCPGDQNPLVNVTGGYDGLADEQLGSYDPVYNGYAFFAPLVYADMGGFSSWMYIQNGGYECTSLEIWFKAQDDCNRPRVCDVSTLAPGETYQFDAASCVGPGFVGSAYVRASQPVSIVVDQIGQDVLMSYTGNPSELKYTYAGAPFFTTGSQVAYGPLTYSEYQGWDSLVQVQNLSQINNAKVKVYFLDRSGGIIDTLVDWICPGGSAGFFLPIISALPGNWVGSVRVESQDWFVAGQPGIEAPNVTGVVAMTKYGDATRTTALEAMAYSMFPEQRAYDWQTGSGYGGLYSGVGRIGIPSFMKDLHGTGLSTELAINNVVPVPGFTDFVIYIYDQNGLINSLCEKLGEKQVEYLDVASNLGILPDGFKGSAVISAVYWEHYTFDQANHIARNVVGLAAVKIERSSTMLGMDIPGDESAASPGFPIIGPFAFAGPVIGCPGVPTHGPWQPGGAPIPTPYPIYPTSLPPGGGGFPPTPGSPPTPGLPPTPGGPPPVPTNLPPPPPVP
ncbi:MAG: carboxypeptidase-like regulatory domain-containing protein [Ardenticatenales bacterium]